MLDIIQQQQNYQKVLSLNYNCRQLKGFSSIIYKFGIIYAKKHYNTFNDLYEL